MSNPDTISVEANIVIWKGQSMQYRCECEFCHTGKATTHNNETHDQSLYLSFPLSSKNDPALQSLTIVGGTTKCARVMSRFLETDPKFGRCYFESKAVLELGSGTGLVGIILGMFGADVMLTDQSAVMELLQENIEHNMKKVSSENIKICGKLDVCELYWGEDILPVKIRKTKFDTIIGSDLIFAKENIPLLVKTFGLLCKPENSSEILFAHIDRFSWEDSFFSSMKSTGFTVEQVYMEDEIKIFKFIRFSNEEQ